MIPAVASSPRRKTTTPAFLVSLALLLVVSWTPVVWADYEHYCNPDSFSLQQSGVCGDDLVDLIGLYCTHFAGKYVVKRSYPSDIDAEVHELLVNKKDAFSFLSKRQSKQNILCECCVNQCSPMELLQYCPVPSIRRVRSALPPAPAV